MRSIASLAASTSLRQLHSKIRRALINRSSSKMETQEDRLASWTQAEPAHFDDSFKKKLPVEGKRNILITSALPYVNNVPHLGNIIGSVLSADVFSRYCRMRAYQSLYVCGTDEYGTATEMKALQEGVTPKEICDKFHALHRGIYEWFNIDFDVFGRTTTPQQTELTQDIFLKAHANGFTSTADLQQLHCGKCDKFLADRFVHGTCPHCQFDDARGDQCDGCGKLLDAVELVEPKCHNCGSKPTVRRSTHIFLNLDALSKEVEDYVEGVVGEEGSHWSANAAAIVRSWLKTGIEKRCITRDLKWGVPVPLKGFEDKVFYVWFDAPVGYLSITKTLLGDDWTKWWRNPAQVKLYQFLGKDNVAFHGIIFPAALLATREPYTKVRSLCATEYLGYEDAKFSKSRGTGVFGDNASSTGIPADVWRFYLIYMRPESQDTVFCWDDFMAKVNGELLSNLGNFVLRALSFNAAHFGGVQPPLHLTEAEFHFFKAVDQELAEYIQQLEEVRMREALLRILAISRLGNQYLQLNTPWHKIKGDEQDRKRAGTAIGVATNLALLLAATLYPFMPTVSKEIFKQCNIEKLVLLPERFIQFIKPGHALGKPAALFAKLEPAQIDEWKKKFGPASAAESANGGSGGKDAAATTKGKQQQPKKAKARDKVMSSPAADQQGGDLSATVQKKFEQAKKLCAERELKRLGEENAALLMEVERLRVQLGGEPTPAAEANGQPPNAPLPDPRGAQEPPPQQVPQQAQQKEKPAKTAKPEKKQQPEADAEVDIGRLDLRVGRILEAKKHPDADALYVETIDLGEEKPRTVVSGLVRFVPLEEMQGRLVVCLCNLKPAKMRGVESQAMVMCASTADKVELMEVDASCQPGDRIECPPYVSRPDAQLNPKKKVWETVAVDLQVSGSGEAVYKGAVLKAKGQHPMTAQSLRNVSVK